MTSLVIDIGNTYTKIAVFEKNELLYTGQYQNVETDLINTFLVDYKADKAIISSVKKKDKEEWQELLDKKTHLIHFNSGMTCGIKNHYLTPDTLGLDRLAAVIGAHYLYPGENSLVIDGGTCITYDWVDAGGNYFGGSISPGLNMRYKALNYYTAGLPLVDSDNTFTDNYGNSTTAAIRSGVQNGIKYELAGFVESYK
ncbi:MAG: type pantothenate kinase, partial [Mucilaginibacter sp.]|nr:type pantothenate kinase [Mucilaginibacter sp.]